jgi:hypothetical protein
MGRGDVKIGDFVLLELQEKHIEPPWRNNLLFAAEHVRLSRASACGTLAEVLLEHAKSLRTAVNPTSIEALAAALRRFASLIPPDRAFELGAFLTPEDRIITRQVALQCIQKIFAPRPPSGDLASGVLSPLLARVSELTHKYLDLDWLTPGDNSALAINAFHAAAILTVPRTPEFASRIASFQKPRLVRQAVSVLCDALKVWSSQKFHGDRMAMAFLRESIARLGQ